MGISGLDKIARGEWFTESWLLGAVSFLVSQEGFEPSTHALKGRCSTY
jgi:hypothetical protein